MSFSIIFNDFAQALRFYLMQIPRLHFSETTSNNIRRKGKQNPDQRFFYLVVSVMAEVSATTFLIAGTYNVVVVALVSSLTFACLAERSERIIVRAANANASDDAETLWIRGKNQSAVHHGNVGINTEAPSEALSVHGNVRCVYGHAAVVTYFMCS
jgi:hypothetical protein